MRLFQIIFNPTSASELAKMPKDLQLHILGEFRGLPQDILGTEMEGYGKLERQGTVLHRFRLGDYRIYFQKHALGVVIHRILNRNSMKDFLFRSNLPMKEEEDEALEKNPKFWKLIEEARSEAWPLFMAFMSAEWKDLVLINFQIDPARLEGLGIETLRKWIYSTKLWSLGKDREVATVRCMECGMVLDPGMRNCPKCDTYIYAGNDTKILRVDVAHQGETVEEAVRKLNDAIGRATRENHRKLRVVVGTGLIRDEVGRRLWLYQSQGRLRSYGFEGRNDGAFLVKIV